MYKRTIAVVLLTAMVVSLSSYAEAKEAYPKWKLAVQSYSFKKFTFFEGIEKTAELGLCYIEGSGGRKISPEIQNVEFTQLRQDGEEFKQAREAVKKKLRDSGVKLVSYGVVGLPNDEAECRKVFDFAKEMGFDVIIAEPPVDALDLIERLCKEYNMKVALHNHPMPSLYWHPNLVLEALEGRSELMGACADTGHWMRCGINPVWALKKLEGRIISLHLKDINDYGEVDTHDVPWGTGKGKVKEVLEELNRQKFKGIIAIEYEYNWEDSVPDIKQCIDYFNNVVSELPKEEPEIK